jgi:hypothetical protein
VLRHEHISVVLGVWKEFRNVYKSLLSKKNKNRSFATDGLIQMMFKGNSMGSFPKEKSRGQVDRGMSPPVILLPLLIAPQGGKALDTPRQIFIVRGFRKMAKGTHADTGG